MNLQSHFYILSEKFLCVDHTSDIQNTMFNTMFKYVFINYNLKYLETLTLLDKTRNFKISSISRY